MRALIVLMILGMSSNSLAVDCMGDNGETHIPGAVFSYTCDGTDLAYLEECTEAGVWRRFADSPATCVSSPMPYSLRTSGVAPPAAAAPAASAVMKKCIVEQGTNTPLEYMDGQEERFVCMPGTGEYTSKCMDGRWVPQQSSCVHTSNEYVLATRDDDASDDCYFKLPDQDDFKVKEGEALRFPCSPGSGSVDFVCENVGLVQRNTQCSGQEIVVINPPAAAGPAITPPQPSPAVEAPCRYRDRTFRSGDDLAFKCRPLVPNSPYYNHMCKNGKWQVTKNRCRGFPCRYFGRTFNDGDNLQFNCEVGTGTYKWTCSRSQGGWVDTDWQCSAVSPDVPTQPTAPPSTGGGLCPQDGIFYSPGDIIGRECLPKYSNRFYDVLCTEFGWKEFKEQCNPPAATTTTKYVPPTTTKYIPPTTTTKYIPPTTTTRYIPPTTTTRYEPPTTTTKYVPPTTKRTTTTTKYVPPTTKYVPPTTKWTTRPWTTRPWTTRPWTPWTTTRYVPTKYTTPKYSPPPKPKKGYADLDGDGDNDIHINIHQNVDAGNSEMPSWFLQMFQMLASNGAFGGQAAAPSNVNVNVDVSNSDNHIQNISNPASQAVTLPPKIVLPTTTKGGQSVYSSSSHSQNNIVYAPPPPVRTPLPTIPPIKAHSPTYQYVHVPKTGQQQPYHQGQQQQGYYPQGNQYQNRNPYYIYD